MRKVLVKFCVVLVLFVSIEAQSQNGNSNDEGLLPPLKKPVGCELASRYIDDVINIDLEENKAMSKKENTNLIVIIKSSKNESKKMSQIRTMNLKTYLINRGVTNYVLAIGENTSKYGEMNFYVKGRLIYSIPIAKNKSFNLMSCWIV